jgi:hypothetical protein
MSRARVGNYFTIEADHSHRRFATHPSDPQGQHFPIGSSAVFFRAGDAKQAKALHGSCGKRGLIGLRRRRRQNLARRHRLATQARPSLAADSTEPMHADEQARTAIIRSDLPSLPDRQQKVQGVSYHPDSFVTPYATRSCKHGWGRNLKTICAPPANSARLRLGAKSSGLACGVLAGWGPTSWSPLPRSLSFEPGPFRIHRRRTYPCSCKDRPLCG